MKKKILIIFLVIIFVLTACNSKKDIQNTKNDKITKQKIEKGKSAKEKDFNENQTEDQQNKGTKVEQKILAPDFKIVDLKGNEVNLSDFKGKVIFLNFWATWCTWCKKEMPDIQKVYEKYKKEEKDVVILAVNVNESKSKVESWLKDKKYKFKVLLDEDGTVAKQYYVEAYPTTYIIDKEGHIFTWQPGALKEKDMIKAIEMAFNKEKSGRK